MKKFRLFVATAVVSSLGLMAVNFPGQPAKALDTVYRDPLHEITPKALVTVSGQRPLSSAETQEICTLVHNAMNSKGVVDSECRVPSGEVTDPELGKALRSGQFDFRFDVFRTSNRELKVTFQDLKREDDSDIEEPQGWKVRDTGAVSWRVKLYKIAARVADFEQNQELIKGTLAANATPDSKRVGLGADGRFIDKATGAALEMKEAYQSILKEDPRQRNYLRAGIETALALGFASYQYYQLASNKLDYDYGFSDGLRKKYITFEAMRFDDNNLAANGGHALAGMVYYQIARSSNFSAMESFLFATATSALWETMEYHEVFSINDMIITPIGGYVIGEATYQVCRALRSRSKSLGALLFSLSCDAPGTIGSLLDRNAAPGTAPEGFNAQSWAKFDFSAGLAEITRTKGRSGVNAVELGFEGRVVDIPLFDEPGHEKRVVTSTALANLIINGAGSKEGVEYFKLLAKTAYGVYYEKNLGRDRRGNLDGYAFLFGPTSATELELRPGANGPVPATAVFDEDEFIGTVNMIGPTMDFTAYKNGMKFHLVMDFYADFAMVRSFALDEYVDASGRTTDGLVSVAKKRGYYYGLGYTGQIEINVEKGKLGGGTSFSYSAWESLNQRHRFQEEATDNLSLSDTRRRAKVWISYKLTRNLRLEASLERISRTGNVEDFFSSSASETRKMGRLIYSF